MSSPTGTETSGFRLSMLINDTRYRSLTFQAIALIALIFAIGYLVSNLFSNLSQAGLNINWDSLLIRLVMTLTKCLLPTTIKCHTAEHPW